MDGATSLTELAVGLACVGLGGVIWRRGGLVRLVAVALVSAGVVASVHAVVQLA